MPENTEQVQPLASAADGPCTSDDEETAAAEIRHDDRCIKCCGYIAALLLIQSAIAIILAFTVFRLKAPIIRVENMTVENLELIGGGNVTLNADVLVKNPNFAASFKYGSLTTTLFYSGAVVGEWRAPPGRAEARRSARINITVDIMTGRVLTLTGLEADIYSGLVYVSSYTRVGGKIHVFVIEQKMMVKMKCNMTINITSMAIQQHKCKRKITL